MDHIERSVTEICCAALQRPSLDREQHLGEVGADSLVIVEILTRIEVAFDVDLMEEYFDVPTIAALAAAVRERVGQAESGQAAAR
ncbi:MAG TPA: acyl carrier protein [Natronosporangium sp.]|nr:acyl carrier protein [Natronosporangium sp.]